LNFFCLWAFTHKVRICSLYQELLSTLKQFFGLFYFSRHFHNYLCGFKLYFFTLNLNLNLERPIWFQILSFSLLTLTLTCLFFVFSLN